MYAVICAVLDICLVFTSDIAHVWFNAEKCCKSSFPLTSLPRKVQCDCMAANTKNSCQSISTMKDVLDGVLMKLIL